MTTVGVKGLTSPLSQPFSWAQSVLGLRQRQRPLLFCGVIECSLHWRRLSEL